MGRLGAHPPRAVELGRAVAASPWLEFEGLASHSSPTRPGHPFAQMQVERLATVVAALEADGIRPSLIHMANTAAMIGRTGLEFDLVRPGIALYGVAGPDLTPLRRGVGARRPRLTRPRVHPLCVPVSRRLSRRAA